MVSRSPPDNSADSITFEQHLRKAWIEENWDGGDNSYPTRFTFFITEIKGEKIEGKFSTSMVTYEDNLLGDFTGTVHNGTADCQFDGKYGDKGNMTLDLIGDGKLEVSIEFTEKDPLYGEEDGTYVFRPYNIKDYEKGLSPFRTRSSAVDLPWGNVNIVAVTYLGHKPFAEVFLVNGDGDVLDELGPFANGMEIKEIILEDTNGDGLEDVKFISALPDSDLNANPDHPYFEDSYLQNEKGLFEFSDRIEKNILNHKDVLTLISGSHPFHRSLLFPPIPLWQITYMFIVKNGYVNQDDLPGPHHGNLLCRELTGLQRLGAKIYAYSTGSYTLTVIPPSGDTITQDRIVYLLVMEEWNCCINNEELVGAGRAGGHIFFM